MTMKRILVLVALSAVVGCRPAVSPQVLQSYQNRTLYTCCNIHHEGQDISDANYYVGTMVPLGAGVKVQSAGRTSLTFTADGTLLTLSEDYGREQEPFQQYFDKVLVSEDPKPRVARFSHSVQQAIHDSRVEKGMTREQVILSLGYPPAHRTPSTAASEWTYWYNRWVTYKVVFDDTGKVSNVVGRPAPTQDTPVQEDKPPPPAVKKKHK